MTKFTKFTTKAYCHTNLSIYSQVEFYKGEWYIINGYAYDGKSVHLKTTNRSIHEIKTNKFNLNFYTEQELREKKLNLLLNE